MTAGGGGGGGVGGLLERLAEGTVICAEGYLFELERRGYLQAGPQVPEIVLEHPDVVASLHRDLVHAGSDVVEAFTFYSQREKLRLIGQENRLEAMSRSALSIAKEVADATGTLLAGNLGTTDVFAPDDSARHLVLSMFEEQVNWAAHAGVDFVVAETMAWEEEAMLALQAIQEAGLAAVVTLAVPDPPLTREGRTPEDACRRLEDAGAAVVGLNCLRGPETMLPLLRRVRDATSGPVAALPVPFRTTAAAPTFHALREPEGVPLPGGRPFPTALDPFTCNRYEIAAFATEAMAMGVGYFGLCCGAGPHHVRSLAEALGRTPPASRYSDGARGARSAPVPARSGRPR